MKNFMKSLMAVAAMMIFVGVANQASAQNGNSGVNGAAIGALASAGCLQANGGNCDLVTQERVVSICFVQGFITVVDVYKVCDNCPAAQEPCPRPLPQYIGSVTLGCEGEVLSATCGN